MRTVGIDRSYYAPIPEEDLDLLRAHSFQTGLWVRDEGVAAGLHDSRVSEPSPAMASDAGKPERRAFLDSGLFIDAGAGLRFSAAFSCASMGPLGPRDCHLTPSPRG